MIWFFTWINSKGIRTSGTIQVITTVLNTAFSLVAALTLYAFLGLESASIPVENIKSPSKIVPKATMLGTIISTCIYILGTVVLFGVLPIETLQNSPAPFAEAGQIIGGKYTG